MCYVQLTAGFGVAGLDLILLSFAFFPTVLRWRTGAGACPDGAPAATALVTAGPGTPAGPASINCTHTHKQQQPSRRTGQ